MGEGSYINLWLGGMGLEAHAHSSMDDALDDISSPGVGAKYRGTLIESNGQWTEIDLSAPAQIYAARTTEEWLYWAGRANSHSDKVA